MKRDKIKLFKIKNNIKLFFILASMVIFSSLFMLGIVEISVRIFEPQPQYYNPQYLFISDNELGCVLNPNFKGEMRTPESTTVIKINSTGQRDKEYTYYSKDVILALGDSFAFGSGVEIEDTFLWGLEELLSQINGGTVRVVKAGVPGYGTKHQYLYFKRKGVEYNPHLVIVCFYINDVMDNTAPSNTVVEGYVVPSEKVLSFAKKNKKFTITQKFILLFDNLHTTRFILNRLSATPKFRNFFLEFVEKFKGRKGNRLELYHKYYEPKTIDAWQITFEYLKKIDALTKSIRGKLLVVYIPERQQVYANQWIRIIEQYRINKNDYEILKPNKLMESFCQKNSIEFLDLTNDFRNEVILGNDIYFTMDPHINKNGHALAAKLIYKKITINTLIPLQ